MLYRSPVTRWLLTLTGMVAGLLLTFGPGDKWRSTPSLHWLGQAPIPLQTWGVLMMLYALLLLPESTRPAGYALGCFLFALLTVSLIATVGEPGPKSIAAIAATVDCTVFHAYSIRTAWAVKLTAS